MWLRAMPAPKSLHHYDCEGIEQVGTGIRHQVSTFRDIGPWGKSVGNCNTHECATVIPTEPHDMVTVMGSSLNQPMHD